jgi:hypothetical protein
MEGESLKPQLDHAQQALRTALEEACGVDLHKVNTGELIRIEETLAVASRAAKDAVSVRLRMRNQRAAADKSSQGARQRSPATDTPITSRVFDDIHGKRWHVYAIRPSAPTVERAALPEAFRQGWLTFESTDETRRVAPIPDGWEHAETEALRQLCHNAERSPRRMNAPHSLPEKPHED